MSDDFTVKLIFSSEGAPRTVGDIQKINKELEEAAKQNKALAVEASQLAGLFNLSGREAADVKAALADTAGETEEAVRAARVLAEVYGLSADEVEEVEAAVRAVTEESAKAKEEFQALVAAGATALSATIGVFLSQAVDQFSQFEQFEGVLQQTFGDTTEVENAISLVDTFADTAAQDLTKVEASYQNLISRGIQPTSEQLRQLTDISVSQGKEIDQLVEAILDAQQGENERLKEFGISADATGKQLELTFRGITIEAEKTPDAIADAIFSLGDLQGVAGAAASNVTSLQGRLTLLSNESTRASRTFGELVASGFEPIIIGATELLTTFNALPPAVQGVVTTSTAFVGALSAAVAAVTAYNSALGKRVVNEALATVTLGKRTVAQIANTVSTQSATVAQAAYAVATGKATAAQQAQVAAIVGAAGALAAFTGAAASVGLVVSEFLVVTEESRKTREQIGILRKSIESLDQIAANPEGADGITEYGTAALEAAANVEALEERLSFVTRFLDRIRGFELNGNRVFFDATSVETEVNQARIAFAELTADIDGVILRGAQAANALENSVTLPPGEVQGTVAAIDAAKAALEALDPVTAEAIQRRDAQIEKLEEYRERIIETTEGVAALGDSTDDLKNRLTELNDALEVGGLGVEQVGQAALVALEQQRAEGLISSENYQRRLQDIEEAGFTGRLALANDKLAELRELERATTDEESLEQIQQEILKTEIEVSNQRIAISRSRSEEQERLEKEAEAAAKEAAKEKRDAAIKAAKEETDALKRERAEQKRLAEETFDSGQRQESSTFDTQQRQTEARFDTQQRQIEERFQDQLRADKASFEDDERARQSQFESRQQSAQETFNDRQRAEEKIFQDQLNEDRAQGNREFDALEQEINNRVALAEADTRQARKAVQERIEAEEESAKIRREVEEDVLRQRNSILSDEDTELSPLEQARADFETKLQAEEAEFQNQQRLETQNFEDTQQLAKETFENNQRLAQEEFENNQREQERTFADQQREAEATFADQQRQLEQTFEDQQRQTEAAFRDDQRQKDEDSADEIKRILDSARNTGTEARRDGGPIKAGQPYLVGEAGPELIFPSRSGFVATAGQTAKLLEKASIQLNSQGITPVSGLTGIEKKLDQLIELTKNTPRPRIAAGGNTFNINGEPDPSAAAQRLLLDQLKGIARGL